MEARRSAGITLWELAAALAIAGVVIAAAVPTFAELGHAAAVRASTHEIVTAAHFARSHAILVGRPTRLCLTLDLLTCMPRAGGPARGMLVDYRDPGGDSAPNSLKQHEFSSRVAVFGTRAAITYWPVSRSGTTATFNVCTRKAGVTSRSVIVSQTGRPRTRMNAVGRGDPCAT